MLLSRITGDVPFSICDLVVACLYDCVILRYLRYDSVVARIVVKKSLSISFVISY